MKKYKLVVSVLMATLLVACGGNGGNPNSPSSYVPPAPSAGPTPAPTPLPSSAPTTGTKFCFVNDLAESVLAANANITLVGGENQNLVTDETACVTVPAGGTLNYVDSPGFRRLTDFSFQREDVALPQGTYALWPTNGYLEHLEEVDETNGVVYSGFASFSGQRPRSGVYTVALPGEMASATSADANAYRAAMDVILANASGDTSNKILFTVASGGSANIQIIVDPALSSAGYLIVTAYDDKGFIKSGVLKIRDLDMVINWPGLIRHELGHFSGVNHINDRPDRLMYRSAGEFATATEPEVVHFRMRFLRPAGFDARKG